MSLITFYINGTKYEVDKGIGPAVSLNDYIRTVADLRGTKAMCHEGGCGACIVSVTAPLPPDHVPKTFSVNSCLVAVLSCHGWEVMTVEGIGNRTIGYHDIQSRLANFNGTQCGYCTPGWIMNMYSLYQSHNKKLTSTEIENSFASNMCRCTGYRPIADAFKSFAIDADKSLLDKMADMEDLGIHKPCGVKCATSCRHKKCSKKETKPNDFTFVMDDKMMEIEYKTNNKWYRAYSLEDVFSAMKNGKYTLIAGNTGHGIYNVADFPPNVIDIFNVIELKGWSLDMNLILGAGMPLSDMMELFKKLSAENQDFSYLKQLYDHMDLVAHIPVRNIGTIGGNLYLKYQYNEFQSDLFLLFETVGAMMTIGESPKKTRIVSFPDFLKLNMKEKLILKILLPPLSKFHFLKTYKIMPRAQNAHAVVNAGFLFEFRENSNLLERATIVYGSISESFIHASKTEALLQGRDPYTEETLKAALQSLALEIVPVESPPEPSASYRKLLAINLYYKAILSLCPEDRLNPRYRSGGEAIKRHNSKGSQSFETDESVWPLNQPIPKLEALVQCGGEGTFANDLPAEKNEVFAAFVTADAVVGSIIEGFDTTEAMKLSGVIAFYTAKDIPGNNDFTPTFNTNLLDRAEEILCESEVKYFGQPAAIIVAKTEKIANSAAQLVTVKYSKISTQTPLLSVEEVLKSPQRSSRCRTDTTVEADETGDDVKQVITGEMNIKSQYHYFMEPQTCVVRPTEDGMEVYSATQWLDLINIAVARCLKVPENHINVIVRRVGGGYGGKISRSSQVACAAALVSHLLGRTCRLIVPLMTNMKSIGKRIGSYGKYEVGINKDGVIQYLKLNLYEDAGYSYNESLTSLCMQGLYNCYTHTRWTVDTNSVTTDTPSNTWCRAPYSTEGVAMIENIMENIAFHTGMDPIDVRLNNINTDYPIPEMINQLKKDADYDVRKIEVDNFNTNNRWRKRAIKLLPLSIDIYYSGIFNALVTILHGDGTVVITHGGVEMGQGLNTKVAQVAAYKLGVPLSKISVKPSATFTSPNTIITGGSVGSESVSLAIVKICDILNERLASYKKANPVWEDAIEAAYQDEVDLQESYMVAINKDSLTTYYVHGVVIMEIEVDILTGNHDVLRVDLLEDTGRSLSPEIDVAQIEGAFMMGLGYWSCENLIYDNTTGELLTTRTWNYKIPGIKDIPADFRIYFLRGSRNESGVLQSKGTGEPALCLATVFIHAVREAVRAARLEAGYKDTWFDLEKPCNVEHIFTAVEHKLEHLKLK